MVAAQFKKRTTMLEFTIPESLIPLDYIKVATDGGANTVKLAEMANRNAKLMKRYFHYVFEANQWKRIDLNSKEKFKQTIDGSAKNLYF